MDVVDGANPFKVAMPDGMVYLIQPGKRSRGIQVQVVREMEASSDAPALGRKPSKAALLLRSRLNDDARAGKLGEATDYVVWVMGHQDDLSLQNARNLVYRELRRVRGSGLGEAPSGRGGQRPRPSTLAVRKAIERDHAKGKLKRNAHYVKLALSKDEGLSESAANQMVYRELKRVS